MSETELKEKCIKLFLQGKTFTEIAKLTGWSRTFITNLIKNDKRIIDKRNTTKIKVYKNKKTKRISLTLNKETLNKIGISDDSYKDEYVNVLYNEKDNSIVIRKA